MKDLLRKIPKSFRLHNTSSQAYQKSLSFSIDPDITLARTPPGSFYRPSDESTFASQCEKIFKSSSSWMYSPDVLKAKNKGDAVPFSLLNSSNYSEPLVAVKDMNGLTRVLSNVCTHRGKILIDGKEGHSTSILSNGKPIIRCGYHGRRFSSDGRCIGAPGFDSIVPIVDDLPEASLNVVRETLPFVSLRRRTTETTTENESFNSLFGDIFERLSFLPINDLRPDDHPSQKSFTVQSHWSLYVENYLEGLHVPFVHPTLNNALTMSQYKTELLKNSSLQIGPAALTDDDSVLLPSPTSSSISDDRVVAYYAWLFPNLMLNFYHWGCSVNVVVPLGPSLTRIDYSRLVWGKEGKKSASRPSAGDNLDDVEKEDDAVVESVQKGIGASLYTRGRYSEKWEKGTHHFHRLLMSRLQ
jgi:choline monooxygenase